MSPNAFETDSVQRIDGCKSCGDWVWLQCAGLACISLVSRVTTACANVEAQSSWLR